MRLHKLSSMILAAAVLLTTSFVQGQTHAPWPTDWNNWSDPALMVTVGNAGNAADWTSYGSVDHAYAIGKYEVTAGQYTAFLNNVAATDTYGLYNASMWTDTYACKIEQTGSSGSYAYSVAADYANRPVNFVSFWDAARFSNWLHNGQGAGDTETGAYTLTPAGMAANTITKNSGAQWWLPSKDEWYKAAYHKNDGVTGNYFLYPTSSDSPPSNVLGILTDPGNNATYYDDGFTIGSPYYRTEAGAHENSDSPYGTFDQGGNVWEWNDTIESSSRRGLRAGDFMYGYVNYLSSTTQLNEYPTYEDHHVGFRVASVPEPGSVAMLLGLALTALLYGWRRRG